MSSVEAMSSAKQKNQVTAARLSRGCKSSMTKYSAKIFKITPLMIPAIKVNVAARPCALGHKNAARKMTEIGGAKNAAMSWI